MRTEQQKNRCGNEDSIQKQIACKNQNREIKQ